MLELLQGRKRLKSFLYYEPRKEEEGEVPGNNSTDSGRSDPIRNGPEYIFQPCADNMRPVLWAFWVLIFNPYLSVMGF